MRDTLALLCAAPNVTCTFESGLCSWKKGGGKGKWVRGTRTPSSSTGAAKGHGGKGYFMFLETSSPSSKGWTSYLTHAVKAGYDSIAFAYHMHGATMGELRVEAQVATGACVFATEYSVLVIILRTVCPLITGPWCSCGVSERSLAIVRA